jgi:uncharacterized membrane protein
MTIDNEFPLLLFLGVVLIVLIAFNVQGLPHVLPMVRLVLGLLYVLYVPGYTLQAALFPRADDLDGPERLALSFGLSVAVVPPMALLLDALPWGIRLWPIAVAEATFIILCSTVALSRRRRLPPAARPVLHLHFNPGRWWRGLSRVERVLYGVLAVALLGFAIGATAIIVTPKPGEKLTEFYILGPEGLAENYPREVLVSSPVTVTMGIVNDEGMTAHYRVEVYHEQRLIGQAGPFHLPAGTRYEGVLSFVPTVAGNDIKIDILLYRLPGKEPYRSLRLWMKVKGN